MSPDSLWQRRHPAEIRWASWGKAGLDEFSDACAADPAWRALAGKVVSIDDDSFGIESATVALQLRNGGGRLARHVAVARGSLGMPLRDTDLDQKLAGLAAWVRSGCAPQPIIAALWSLDEQGEAGSLMMLVEGRD